MFLYQFSPEVKFLSRELINIFDLEHWMKNSKKFDYYKLITTFNEDSGYFELFDSLSGLTIATSESIVSTELRFSSGIVNIEFVEVLE